MKALLVGGAGFVGTYLADYLSRGLGWDAEITKLKETDFSGNAARVYDMDLLSYGEIEETLSASRPDVIFHLAAQSSVALSWKNPQLTVDVNIKGSVNLLEAVRNSGANPRIVLIGSGEEYGYVDPADLPLKETAKLRPGNIYAATKACQETVGFIYARAYGMDVISTRSFNHIGPGQPSNFVISDFCRQVAEIEKGMAEPLIRTGNLSAKRDFLDIRDAVAAYGALAEKGTAAEVYNVGGGRAVSIKSILDDILSLSEVPVKAETDPAKLRPADVPVIEADISKISSHTGWSPSVPLKDSLRDTLNYWRKTV